MHQLDPVSPDLDLTLAARYGSIAMVRKLLRSAVMADNAFLSSERAGLVRRRAIDHGHLAVVQLLLQAGLDVNLQYRGASALHEAVRADSWEVLQFLLRVPGIQRHVENLAGRTALMDAASLGRVRCVSVLLAAGCRPDHRGSCLQRMATHWCVSRGLLPRDPDDTLACLAALKDKGADLDSCDSLGCTPLHLAVVGEETEVVRWLVQNGCSLEAASSMKNLPHGYFSQLERSIMYTPLLAAIHLSNRQIAQLLLSCGARCSHLRWTLPFCRQHAALHSLLFQHLSTPSSLQQLCRVAVREAMGPGVEGKVAGLTHVPGSVRSYLLLVEELKQA